MLDLTQTAKETRAWACYDCGKCTATCPVARAGAPYSPRRHVLATNRHSPQELAHDGSLASCLTCRLCDARCPAQVAYTDLVRRLRELAHRARSEQAEPAGELEPECPHGGALQSVMRMMGKGSTQQNRLAWLAGAEPPSSVRERASDFAAVNPPPTPSLEGRGVGCGELKTEPERGQVFYWTGCTMYYDAFFPELELATLRGTRAAVGLMNALGITPVVSPNERCCGHDLLWNGDRENFERLARQNVQLVADSGAELLVTSCAECLRTWKLDYAPFFAAKPPRMVHLTQFLTENLAALPLKPDGQRRVTFQDPCRLGRHLGLYEPPRQVLAALPGVELVEMRRHGPAAICCAGGTWSNCDRFAKQVQVERLREARATGATVLVTACPKCQIHFRCAMNDPKLGSDIEIELRDIAELVADAVKAS